MIETNTGISRFYTARDGLRLHMLDFGPRLTSAIPVVCLPGLARTGQDFERLALALADGAAAKPRRVLALDYRGRGASDRDPTWQNYDLRIENDDILDTLAAAGIDRAIFIGTSRGGLHIMLIAAMRPALLHAAVLNDIGPVIETKGLARLRGYIGKLPQPRHWSDTVDIAKSLMSAQFTDMSDADWEAFARLTFEEKNGKLRARYDSALFRTLESIDLEKPLPTAWPQFEGLRDIPTLVLRGANSDLLSAETVAEMQKRHPRCQAHVVDNQGHAPLLLDAPTIARLARFIAEADPA
ncbi:MULTISPECIES: alpha/beta hydrolase [unclassified Beijerinckia]|uniref:alpha/beta fold hydrolase n=1 Tax=unclassified Beijerinckia TaxID=2638183 RepID=UPI00089629BB|nr:MULTISPECIES: alpha/beta hydrolase [unclassified Beijerinckia]MDH7794610.1 pimeloyl-ACP methyl ester carboxylesterase [Beijerinckia sp. GAS462]SEB68439.1 Pimeloyl-ACP methyl ester carboxylesterase [Beijerinckia sp. 28-YEA-48]